MAGWRELADMGGGCFPLHRVAGFPVHSGGADVWEMDFVSIRRWMMVFSAVVFSKRNAPCLGL